MITKKNYYDVLEIQPNATNQEIKDAFSRSRNSYSGESVAMYSLMTKGECDEILTQIEEAYSILGDPQRRQEYDNIRGLNKNNQIAREGDFTFNYDSNNGSSSENRTTGHMSGNPNSFSSPQDSFSSPQNSFSSPQNSFSSPQGGGRGHDQNINKSLLEETFGRQRHRANSDLVNETQELATEMRKDVSTDKAQFTYNEAAQIKSEADVSKFTALKKFTLDFNPNLDFEQKIENATDFQGVFLKKIREYKNVSVQRMAEMTRISKTYIKHIEEDDFEKLPADVYTRGFIYQYAKCLKLNPDLVASSYLHYLRQNRTTFEKR
jgi:curved DNA-binding protein CbpA